MLKKRDKNTKMITKYSEHRIKQSKLDNAKNKNFNIKM